MLDLHTHLLPEIDDGARNFPETLKIIKKEMEDGVQQIVVTPNFISQLYEPTVQEIQEGLTLVKKALTELDWPVEILPGMEVRLSPDLFSQYNLGDFLTINQTRYLLVDLFETPLFEVAPVLDEMIAGNLWPILAHPEKYVEVQENTEILNPWLKKHVLFQVSTDSLSGLWGKKVQSTAEKLILERMVHILATDVHNPFRNFVPLSYGLEIARRLIGEDAELLVAQNCDMIVQGKSLF